ncbi:MAG: hypothetical protein HQL46_08730 [Gammaproteobacteria bacterium]|nr:hypothetical protein [Gammaproteobacteria bacterium]
MPSNEYRCEANGLTYEVKHAMNVKTGNCDELCAKFSIYLSGGNFVHSLA